MGQNSVQINTPSEARQVYLQIALRFEICRCQRGSSLIPHLRQSKPARELFSAGKSGLGAGDGNGVVRITEIKGRFPFASRAQKAHYEF
jgi:hypothetical protein